MAFATVGGSRQCRRPGRRPTLPARSSYVTSTTGMQAASRIREDGMENPAGGMLGGARAWPRSRHRGSKYPDLILDGLAAVARQEPAMQTNSNARNYGATLMPERHPKK